MQKKKQKKAHAKRKKKEGKTRKEGSKAAARLVTWRGAWRMARGAWRVARAPASASLSY
jgi:hypothetical protein